MQLIRVKKLNRCDGSAVVTSIESFTKLCKVSFVIAVFKTKLPYQPYQPCQTGSTSISTSNNLGHKIVTVWSLFCMSALGCRFFKDRAHTQKLIIHALSKSRPFRKGQHRENIQTL